MHPSLTHATPQQLASLLSIDTSAPSWGVPDVAAMWRQLLATAILPELGRVGAATQAMADACATAAPPIHTFGDLIGHPAPPPVVFDATRRFAKNVAADPQQATGAALYHGILATEVASGLRLSKLTDEQRADGFLWLLQQPWLDDRTRELVTHALRRLNY